ncbi:MAG: DUF4830 domain-containing protein [Ruminococcus sp.]|nr:DUF4830 domain-containing protein [Ruminococcus sp.]
MYIKTIKLRNVKQTALLLAVIALAVTALVLVIGAVRAKASQTKVGSEKERQAFLSEMGWKVSQKPESTREITIPEKFDKVYKTYNDLQKEQGFDLSDYKGKKATVYTYTVTNYKGYSGKDCIKANLIVCDGKLIGGDVCSVELGGFMQGLRK